jgi:hypothetical protein
MHGAKVKIKDKLSDRPNENHATSNRIHLLPLLKRRDWKQPVFKNVCTCVMFCAIL